MSDPFQFITLEQLRTFDSPIVCVITADMVQDYAEHECGGRLSDDQLRLFHVAGFGRVYPNFLAWMENVIGATRALARQVQNLQRHPKNRAASCTSGTDILKGPWDADLSLSDRS